MTVKPAAFDSRFREISAKREKQRRPVNYDAKVTMRYYYCDNRVVKKPARRITGIAHEQLHLTSMPKPCVSFCLTFYEENVINCEYDLLYT